jgi:N-acetylglucosamine-6-sulfatase
VSAASPSRPNIVLVLTDDLSANLVRYMPHVQALEEAGTSFSNFTVTDSLCCPSRASIFTGKFPHDTGVFTNAGPDGGFTAFQRHHDEDSTFATALHSSGYRTAMMGKYLNAYGPHVERAARPYSPPGWSEWDGAAGGYEEFRYDLDQDHQVVHYGSAPQDYLTDVLSRRAVQFISACPAGRKRPAPFMLEVATFAPHSPYVPAPRDAHAFPGLRSPRGGAYDRLPRHAPPWLSSRGPLTGREKSFMDGVFRKRVQSVQAVDRLVGAIQDALRRAGDARNTDIVFSSDNGYHLGEYRLPPGKMTAFDSDVRVPLVAAGPGIPAGRVTGAVAENVDLAPTFEQLAGLRPPSKVDGRSLVPLLHGATPARWRTAALVEHHKPDASTVGPDRDSMGGVDPPSYEAMRTGDYTYVEYADGTREFYDLRRDPDELDNLARRLPASTLRTLHRDLVALEHCHGARRCAAADHPRPIRGVGAALG